MDTDGPRSAFVSYSWDDKAHRSWVRKFATSLVRAGIDVKLDQWDVGPGDSLTEFMEKQIVNCDYVIVICTPLYAMRSQQRQGGVGYEQQMISGHIAAGVPRHKFIPVVRKGRFETGKGSAIPPHFSGIYAIDMRKDAQYREGIKSLLLAIHEAPQLRAPKLGARFPRRRDTKTQSVRLPIMELDGWRLQSGVAMNQEHPKTFWLPSERARQNVKKGDLVKLMFDISIPHSAELGGFSGERVWVKIAGRKGAYFTGTLENQPLSFYETDVLKFGDQVVFLPEHVIDIIYKHQARSYRNQARQSPGQKERSIGIVHKDHARRFR